MGKIAAMRSEILGRLFKKPPTELYPFEKTEMPDGLRGAIEFDWEKCKMCGLCAKFCPAEAIKMVPVSETKKAPLFFQDGCIYCGQCAEVCPPKIIVLTKVYETAGPNRQAMRIDHIKEISDLLKKKDAAKAAAPPKE